MKVVITPIIIMIVLTLLSIIELFGSSGTCPIIMVVLTIQNMIKLFDSSGT